MAGLYLVTTPIGNTKDLTPRALEAIQTCDVVFSEDTRVFRKLCSLLEIDISAKHINSFHDHSSEQKLAGVVALAKEKKCLFLSDAGSPIISDPAYPLIQMCIKEGVKLHSVPGVSSIITALELSGLAPIPFHFHGFLARDKSKKNKDFEMIGNVYGTHIFFEGVSRVLKTVKDLTDIYPEFDFVIARELTKSYESVYRFKGKEFERVQANIVEKGEFVLLVHNSVKNEAMVDDKLVDLAQEIIDSGARPKTLAKLLSKITGENNKEIYKKLNISK